MSILTLVATPIGNLEDLSPRAKRTLEAADVIYAEDTRHTGRLLAHIAVHKVLRSCHDHNEASRAAEIVEQLEAGRSVALVTDAGTPAVADPGFRVVKAAVERGLAVTMVPGPSSIVMALVLSGFATDRFVFDGWLPRKPGALRARLASYEEERRTVVLLESPHRLLKTLRALDETLPHRLVAVCRELTKRHEEVRRGTAADVLLHYEHHAPRGELVLVLGGEAA